MQNPLPIIISAFRRTDKGLTGNLTGWVKNRVFCVGAYVWGGFFSWTEQNIEGATGWLSLGLNGW